jgi:SHS2 domain-containing protein
MTMEPVGTGRNALVPGVQELEHTADVGIEIRADCLADLFRRAAAGTMALIAGGKVSWPPPAEPDVAGATDRLVVLAQDNVESLLVHWLRELLYLLEVEGFAYRDAEFVRLDESSLEARVRGTGSAPPQVCEVKGVTYHGLCVERVDATWRAQVIFDI